MPLCSLALHDLTRPQPLAWLDAPDWQALRRSLPSTDPLSVAPASKRKRSTEKPYAASFPTNFVDPSGLDPKVNAGLQAAASILGVNIDPSSIPVYSASGLDPGAFGETGYVWTGSGYQLAIIVSNQLSSQDAALVAGHELLHYLRDQKRDKPRKGDCPKNRPIVSGKQNLQDELDARRLGVQLSKLFSPMNTRLAQAIQLDAQAFSNPQIMQDNLLPTLIFGEGYQTAGQTPIRNVTGLTRL